jgi:hypothetical protein
VTPHTVLKNIPCGAIPRIVLREKKLFTEHSQLPIWDLPTYFIIGLSGGGIIGLCFPFVNTFSAVLSQGI